jgi:superfamily II DNA/RNA helicase
VQVSRTASTADTIDQKLVKVSSRPDQKRAMLRARVDAAEGLTNAIIFCNRKRDVATLARSLERHGYSAGGLHGDMDQKSRTETLDAFKSGNLTLLVASDVAARGLDIPAVSHVFNFDVPVHAEDYVHRIGRTGRAGRSGTAYTFVGPGDEKHLDAILMLILKPIDWLDVAPVASSQNEEEAPAARPARTSRRKAPTRPSEPQPVEAAPEKAPARNARRRPKDTQAPASDIVPDSPFGDAGPIPAFLLRSTRTAEQESE